MHKILISEVWKDKQNKTNQKKMEVRNLQRYNKKLSYLLQTKIVLPLIKT